MASGSCIEGIGKIVPLSSKPQPFASIVASQWQTAFFEMSFNQRKSLIINGAPVKIRTSNLLIRSQMLYPVELRALRKST